MLVSPPVTVVVQPITQVGLNLSVLSVGGSQTNNLLALNATQVLNSGVLRG